MTYVKYKEQVFKVSSDIISFANDSSYNIVSKLQELVDISEVKSVTVEYNGAEHTIDITHNDSDMTFVLDGQKVDTKKHKQYTRALSVWRLTEYIKTKHSAIPLWK